MKWATTILVFCVAALLGLGVVMLYSATSTQVGIHYLLRQSTGVAIGVLGCAAAATIDYHHLKKLSPFLLAVAVLLLILVLMPSIGIEVKGARRWLGHGSYRFQASEFAKLALIIFLAHYVEHFQRRISNWREGLVIPGIVILVVIGLVFVEPDRGCAILLACVCGAILFIAGMPVRALFPPIIAGMAFLAFSLWHDPVRFKRIEAWLHPELAKEAAGYQAYQAMIALGSGGWTGLGLGNGRQKLGFVPEHYSDFLFSILGEELGLVATLAVVVAFVVIVICGTLIARRAGDTFGMLLAAGITFMIGFQAFINIGVVTSALPNKGMPLPFMSYGPSNLIIMLVSVGLLLSVSRFAVEPETHSKNPFELSNAEIFDA